MASIPSVIEAMQIVLGEKADELGRSSGFIKRQRKVSGSTFAQGLVFGWLGNESASLNELKQAFGQVGVEMSRQNVAQRLTRATSEFMGELVQAAFEMVIQGQPQNRDALAPFGKVYLMDSTTITLPAELSEVWEGIQGSGLKLSVCWDIQNGDLPVLHRHASREHDRRAPMPYATLRAGDLWTADLAYLKLDDFAQLDAQGAYWISRYKAEVNLYNADGTTFELEDYLDALPDDDPHEVEVFMGLKHRLPVRLVMQRVTDPDRLARRTKKLKEYERKKQTTALPLRHHLNEYDVFVTNIPKEVTSPALILEIARLRWQIELLFKLWKNEMEIDEWRTTNPWRILCEVYAKLIAIIIQHWLFLMGDVHHLEQSLTLARQVVRQFSWTLARSLWDTLALEGHLVSLQRALRTCHTHSSPKRLSSFKRLSP